jgi:hypothetical protein
MVLTLPIRYRHIKAEVAAKPRTALHLVESLMLDAVIRCGFTQPILVVWDGRVLIEDGGRRIRFDLKVDAPPYLDHQGGVL